ncbi:type II toxin-antitoxin system RelE/ParE family toxin [Rhodococcus globerulus]|uniref:Type II toxin-antitoxin system RelE/ParE family toxin n=1 Tax=Rhodococcus globerulus TaxID=33008 RepID=A0ABU4C3T1_RHOGO|nr:type II toxin-antitoxin system RelE/ParE family toxin [Rhodococcus globerulus]MDV6271162.1 type II toxin-antitoxin system RelE/ParE family toxin [Rhodococcus globerulus]
MGSALDDLRDLPADVQDDLGYQIGRVQLGLDPDDWKPMKDVGAGCREIRVRTSDGAFRTFYVARFEGAIYVLHCFRKKTQKTSKSDIEVGRQRYKAASVHAKGK